MSDPTQAARNDQFATKADLAALLAAFRVELFYFHTLLLGALIVVATGVLVAIRYFG
jgi:hypothetical protein